MIDFYFSRGYVQRLGMFNLGVMDDIEQDLIYIPIAIKLSKGRNIKYVAGGAGSEGFCGGHEIF